jgi:hypothetical protein
MSGHWTDEQLIQHEYGVGPSGNHIDECSQCRARLSTLVENRHSVERESAVADQVPFDLLAAQRRDIYARIERLPRERFGLQVRRWVAAGAMVVLLGGGWALYEENQQQQNKLSDAQLVQEVSQVAQDSEPSPTAPLQALFDE